MVIILVNYFVTKFFYALNISNYLIFLGLCKNKTSKEWRFFNDDQPVRDFSNLLNASDVLKCWLKDFRPCILFYEKRQTMPSNLKYYLKHCGS